MDEIEKMPSVHAHDRPFEPLLSFFEEENAMCFVDDYLEIPLRLDHIIWIASANSTVHIPGGASPLRDSAKLD